MSLSEHCTGHSVVLWAEETSTYRWSRFFSVNCQPSVNNYQLSHMGSGVWAADLRGGVRGPMSINQFVEMTIFLCLICFSIYDKMQGFTDDCGLFIFYLFFCVLCRNSNGHQKWRENHFWEKSPVDSADNLQVKNFMEITLSCSISEINGILHVRRNSRWSPKVAGKQFLRKNASRLCRYPVDQKFCWNRSISFRFRDKHIFVFYEEIQDGHQKWRENNFCEKSPVDCRYHAGKKFHWNRSILLRFRDKNIFAFNAEIQDGRQKWRKNNFCKKLQ